MVLIVEIIASVQIIFLSKNTRGSDVSVRFFHGEMAWYYDNVSQSSAKFDLLSLVLLYCQPGNVIIFLDLLLKFIFKKDHHNFKFKKIHSMQIACSSLLFHKYIYASICTKNATSCSVLRINFILRLNLFETVAFIRDTRSGRRTSMIWFVVLLSSYFSPSPHWTGLSMVDTVPEGPNGVSEAFWAFGQKFQNKFLSMTIFVFMDIFWDFL